MCWRCVLQQQQRASAGKQPGKSLPMQPDVLTDDDEDEEDDEDDDDDDDDDEHGKIDGSVSI